MALPPEPLSELLASADCIVVATVAELLELGPEPKGPDSARELQKPGATDVGQLSARQRVKLKVQRTLVGRAVQELTVEKPEAPYVLRVGDNGPFFLRRGVIIGRYGPDTHPLDSIELALDG